MFGEQETFAISSRQSDMIILLFLGWSSQGESGSFVIVASEQCGS